MIISWPRRGLDGAYGESLARGAGRWGGHNQICHPQTLEDQPALASYIHFGEKNSVHVSKGIPPWQHYWRIFYHYQHNEVNDLGKTKKKLIYVGNKRLLFAAHHDKHFF